MTKKYFSLFLKGFFVLLVIFAHVGCMTSSTSKGQQPTLFDEVLVHNATEVRLTNVVLRDKVSNTVFKCNVILPATSCAIGFPKRKDENHSAEITWVARGEEHSAIVIAATKPTDSSVGKIYIDINSDGLVNTSIR